MNKIEINEDDLAQSAELILDRLETVGFVNLKDHSIDCYIRGYVDAIYKLKGNIEWCTVKDIESFLHNFYGSNSIVKKSLKTKISNTKNDRFYKRRRNDD